MIRVNKKILNKIYKKRSDSSKKYDFGLLIVIGGSELYSGSPALNALAALKSGVDMVRILAPQRAADIIASFSPNLIAYPLEGTHLLKKHLPILLETVKEAKNVSKGKTAVVIGGGLGRSEETQQTIRQFLQEIDIPVVIDADGIYAVSEQKELLKGKPFLLTPHIYEFFVLTGKKVESFFSNEKLKIVREEAEKLSTTILLKGRKDIISNGKELAINTTGSPYLTKGGTGDTLAGICGAILSRMPKPFLAGQAGAYINGKAGEMAAKKFREGLLATDLIDFIPTVVND